MRLKWIIRHDDNLNISLSYYFSRDLDVPIVGFSRSGRVGMWWVLDRMKRPQRRQKELTPKKAASFIGCHLCLWSAQVCVCVCVCSLYRRASSDLKSSSLALLFSSTSSSLVWTCSLYLSNFTFFFLCSGHPSCHFNAGLCYHSEAG